jgi:hypothetical protein
LESLIVREGVAVRVPRLDLLFPEGRDRLREKVARVGVQPAPKAFRRQFLLGRVADVLHHVVGDPNRGANRGAMTGEMRPWQCLLPEGADKFRGQVRVGTHHNVHVPVPLAPLVDGEILEPQPETTEPIPHPPQKPPDGQRELLIRNCTKHRQAQFVGRGKFLKAPA